MKALIKDLTGRRGSQMVEAAIVLPMVILVSVLLIRLFVFYLDILSTGVKEHEAAIEAQKAYEGASITKYENRRTITFLRGGLLGIDVNKDIKTEAFICNEDSLIRAGELFEKD
ncbi:MAG: hypothetical protein Q4B78_05310 [Bacillota bacterium]|nr:hypothetical protein [Bacillota bacterium]